MPNQPHHPPQPNEPAAEFGPNAANDPSDSEASRPARWHQARPTQLPRPTYWPFVLALGLGFMFWGLLTTWIIGVAGLLTTGLALAGWINILRHE